MDDTLSVFLDRILEILADENCENRRQEIDSAFLKYCLEKAGGNRTTACKYAGISLRTLRNQIMQHPEIGMKIEEGFGRNVSPINEKAYRIQEPSPKSKKDMVERIYLTAEVYHLRGLFNFFRPFFNYSEILSAAYRRLGQFKKEPCQLSREAAEELEEDIEIYEENPHLHLRVYIKKRSNSDDCEEVVTDFQPSTCHPNEPEWVNGRCYFCHTNHLFLF